ncbi:hypothetical protein LHYA1_G007502 [Lachnellula hyalina]|uniref:Pre-mRNA splicing factor CLF1 n=1 Tax=Lachnellula hyalina TaxID=1316788 RepID=A0A8H8QY43_9HELO|nr:uncharacterized protein LHYA1_G007502 [Lachnellula hyalina]TVY24869.1 hypothetical protein LHYA1_G007502 [Lachnellula hyalina]
MPPPIPKYPLEDSCSTLFNNTLYTYTSEAFQSLTITQGAEWMELDMGVPVKGGVCVKSTPKNDTSAAALYIVGGTSNSSDYKGLQRYTFADAKWETIEPTVPVTQNRVYHNAAYLNASDSILVFAGNQDGIMAPSSQTFTIQASEPYAALAYPATVPPGVSPLLMQWSESHAMYIGGSETNTKAMIFSPSDGWVDSNATLAAPLYNSSAIKSIVINGDDSSKSLYTFDMSVSPNAVNRTLLVDADGNPVQNSKPIGSRSLEGRQEENPTGLERRGNLTVADWPAYNNTLVPSSTRTSWSMAKDQSGLVVISGGNEKDVLCMFKARDNTWVNATAKLTKAENQGVLTGNIGAASTTASTTASSPSETTSAAAAAAKSNGSDPPFPVKILGAVLGSILGLAAILIVLLFFLRWRRQRKQYADAGHQRRSSGIPDEKDAMDFADRGLPQRSSTRQFRGHEPNASNGSFSSVAILMGRVGHKRGSEKGEGSFSSDSSSQFNKKYKTAISKPIPQERHLASIKEPARDDVAFIDDRPPLTRPRGAPGRRGSMRRSSGWNRYWSGGSALNIIGFGSKRTTYGEDTDSFYSDNRQQSGVTQASAMPPPLKIGGRPELNRVASGSPTIAHLSTDVPSREMSGQIERSGSMSTFSSYTDDHYDAYSSGVPASVHEQDSWTPVDRSNWADGRAPSSNYSESIYTSRNAANNLTQDLRFPTPPTTQRSRPQPPNNDMSWLNLGADRV